MFRDLTTDPSRVGVFRSVHSFELCDIYGDRSVHSELKVCMLNKGLGGRRCCGAVYRLPRFIGSLRKYPTPPRQTEATFKITAPLQKYEVKQNCAVFVIYIPLLLLSNSFRKKLYPQRPSGQAVVIGVFLLPRGIRLHCRRAWGSAFPSLIFV